MTRKSYAPLTAYPDSTDPQSFEVYVSQVIGEVRFDDLSPESAVSQAWLLIGNHVADSTTREGFEGNFRFTIHGQTCEVRVNVNEVPY